MDAEIGGPGPSGRRIVVEFDWTHFTTPAGWCNITQVVRHDFLKKQFIFNFCPLSPLKVLKIKHVLLTQL